MVSRINFNLVQHLTRIVLKPTLLQVASTGCALLAIPVLLKAVSRVVASLMHRSTPNIHLPPPPPLVFVDRSSFLRDRKVREIGTQTDPEEVRSPSPHTPLCTPPSSPEPPSSSSSPSLVDAFPRTSVSPATIFDSPKQPVSSPSPVIVLPEEVPSPPPVMALPASALPPAPSLSDELRDQLESRLGPGAQLLSQLPEQVLAGITGKSDSFQIPFKDPFERRFVRGIAMRGMMVPGSEGMRLRIDQGSLSCTFPKEGEVLFRGSVSIELINERVKAELSRLPAALRKIIPLSSTNETTMIKLVSFRFFRPSKKPPETHICFNFKTDSIPLNLALGVIEKTREISVPREWLDIRELPEVSR